MLHLVFDTETSGLWRDAESVDSPSQPHLVQLAARLYIDTRAVSQMSVLIQPEGWSIEPAAETVHGISEARCHRYGVPLISALSLFMGLAVTAERIIAHNVHFDRKVIEASVLRAGGNATRWRSLSSRLFCTQQESTDLCRLPGKYDWKWPSLEEAHRHFYPDVPFTAQHEGLADVAACKRIYDGIVAARSSEAA